jgi:membrane protein YqaA with SNARE-associated domain
MPEWIASHECTYLFSVSFLAATVVPMGSEWLLAALARQSDAWVLLVVVASIGNVLGSITTYAVGRYGGGPLTEKWLGVSGKQRDKAIRIYRKYGSWSLVLAFLPVIGDPLCFIGGMLRIPLSWFIILVTTGKSLRYLFVALAAMTYL